MKHGYLKLFTCSICLIFFLLFSANTLSAQPMVEGVVSQLGKGEPLSGVMIQIKGSTRGILTDSWGRYGIPADNRDVLLVTYPGFLSMEVAVKNQKTINIQLQATYSLDPEVAVAYRKKKETDLMGSDVFPSVNSIDKQGASSLLQKLEGIVSGLAASNSGAPGAGTTIRMHGLGSLGNSDPLIVIDGMPVKDAYLNFINTKDIKSIQVLKDPATSAIYGLRGGNGVLLIETKNGKPGALQINYTGTLGVQRPVNRSQQLVDPGHYSEAVWQAYENAGRTVPAWNPYSAGRGEIPSYFYDWRPNAYPGDAEVDISSYSFPDQLIMATDPKGTDWWNEIFQQALLREHNLSFSGGNRSYDFFLSGNYLKEEGTLKHTSFERFSLRANSRLKVGRVSLGENFLLARMSRVVQPGGNQSEHNAISQALQMHAMVPVFDVSGEHFAGNKVHGLGLAQNPVAMLTRNKDNKNLSYQVFGNAFAAIELRPNLKARSSFGIDLSHSFQPFFTYPRWEELEPTTFSSFTESWQQNFDWNWTNTLEFKKTINKAHKLQVVGGYEAGRRSNRRIGGGLSNYINERPSSWYLNPDLADPATTQMSSSGNISSLVSQFGVLDYSFNDKYLVSGSIRRDHSSFFPADTGGVFPSYQLGWRISKEKFVKKIKWIDDLLLYYSWGIAGREEVPGGNQLDLYSGSPESSYYDLYGSGILARGYTVNRYGNRQTSWEESESTLIGFNGQFFKHKLNLSMGIFDKLSRNLFYLPQIPPTVGTAASAYVNSAIIENKGIDLSATFQDKNRFGVEYEVNLVFSKFRNTILEIDESVSSFFSEGSPTHPGYTSIQSLQHPIGSFYGFEVDGIFQNQEEVEAHALQEGAAPGRFRFRDVNEDGRVDQEDQQIIGSPWADFTIGGQGAIRYRRWDASIFLFASVGNEIFNYTKRYTVFGAFNSNLAVDVLNRVWEPSLNPEGDLPQLDIEDSYSRQASSFYVEDASYLRIKHLELGYTLPLYQDTQELRLFFQAQNLATFTKYSGIDPAVSNFGVNGNANQWAGYDFGNYPQSRAFLLGLSYRL